MTGKYKRRLDLEEDRISKLPEHLIESILERVPFKYAVRTSGISKQWRYRWTTMKAMVFDEDFYKFAKNGAFGHNGFIRIINQILIIHEGSIRKFQLYLPIMSLDSFQEVDRWMILLSRKGVQEFMFLNANQCYELPSHMFSCLELTKLTLENCFFFKPPLGFEGFPNLETLILCKIDFGCGTQIKLPQLKKLLLVKCTNVYNFNIKATKVHFLHVYDCPDAKFLTLFKNPCLTQVGIHFRTPIQESVLIVEKIPKWLPHAVNSLKRLRLLNFQLACLDQLQGALCVLQNAPNLDTLSVTFLEMKSQVIHYDVGAALSHLVAPNSLSCTLNRLQTVDIISFQGSTLELLFIKLLLAHSPSLHKFNIKPSQDFV
uniref:F-box domain-containing protein n=1 Tax=Lactuca sativa TaxID=4236 RepID=A0A9R1XY15_LACSA|nr:hypothetical protein LSAT_V11C100007170 [Lactuca sativa]